MFLLLTSCDEVESHKTLTFFFDGVPPLRSEVSETASAVQKQDQAVASAPIQSWHTHEPVKDCTVCHGNQPRRTTSPKVQLVAQVPQLCYRCHTEHAASAGWVHGPVATGDCLLCHEPHKTKTESLLRKAVPELCYQCHNTSAVQAIKHHAEPSYGRCVDCHEGHAGDTNRLLKRAFLDTPSGAPYKLDLYRRKYEDALQKARNDLAQGLDFYAMCRTIIDLISSHQWSSARAYLEVFGDSNLILAGEKPKVAEVLQQVTAFAAREATNSPQGPDVAAVSAVPTAAVNALVEQRSELRQRIWNVYSRSILEYQGGKFAEAREGFLEVIRSGLLPKPMMDMSRSYVEKIEKTLKKSL